MADLTSNALAFARVLRSQYGIEAGHPQAREALRALETVGVRDPDRARYALRSVFCSKREELERFDRAFDAFFLGAAHRARSAAQPEIDSSRDAAAPARPSARREPDSSKTLAQTWSAMRARYSPVAGRAPERLRLPVTGLARALTGASRLVAALRLGRSRRWKAHVRGRRFDLRGTLRASLQTGGDPVRIRTLGHPLRNPRIVLLLDGSRSMSEHAPGLLQFGYALCRRSNRASVFVFSTELRDVTQQLRANARAGELQLESLGEAWGGGTRIGASLSSFVRSHGSRLDADTLAIVASDGLDVGGVAQLRDAMRQIHRRCAGIFWLNPHANREGFEPAARGMAAALPYVSALIDAKDFPALQAAARGLRR